MEERDPEGPTAQHGDASAPMVHEIFGQGMVQE